MKLIVVASVLDMSLPFGCTPAWWQLLKSLHDQGAEIIATPYHGMAVASLWWRTEENPCYRLSATYAALRNLGRLRFGNSTQRAAGRESFSERTQRRLAQWIVRPRWRRHLFSICEREKNVSAVLFLTVP